MPARRMRAAARSPARGTSRPEFDLARRGGEAALVTLRVRLGVLLYRVLSGTRTRRSARSCSRLSPLARLVAVGGIDIAIPENAR